jgi:hypothetical protein
MSYRQLLITEAIICFSLFLSTQRAPEPAKLLYQPLSEKSCPASPTANAPSTVHLSNPLSKMCQSIQTIYKFCGCSGEFYQQKCPKPTATCQVLLRNPTKLQLTCYCEEHSSRPFKTVRQDQRDVARFNKEYNKILAREKQQSHRASRSTGQDEASASASQAAGEPLSSQERNDLICQRQRDNADFRRKEREMEEYGRKWVEHAMRRKCPIAKSRAEDRKSRKAQEKAMMKRAGIKKLGFRDRSDRACVVM